MIARPGAAALFKHYGQLSAATRPLGVAVMVFVVLAACQRGGGSSTTPAGTSGRSSSASHGASASGDSKRGTGGGSGGTGRSSTGAYTIELARCMRLHGVPSFPDPAGSDQLAPASGIDPTSTPFQTALNGACKRLAPPNWLDDGPGSVPGDGS